MPLDPHPFLQRPSTGLASFPPQLLPLSQKDTDWQKACLDSLEAIGRQQYWSNLKLRENYRMLKGEFLRWQYEEVEQNEYVSLVQMAQEHFDKDIRLHHFDFIKQLVNTLADELEGHPDTHKAKAEGDVVDNARIREKGKLLKEYVDQQIQAEIEAGLVQMGLEPRDDFSSEEEAQAYNQQVEEAKKALTPESIQRYISSNWQHVAEIWANIVLQDARKRYDLPRKMSVEFEDYLTSDRCYRHFYLTGTGFSQETWNPLDVFHSYNPDQPDVEKGDYAGRTFTYSLADVIDKYGHIMTGKQLESLYGKPTTAGKKGYPKDWHGNAITYTSVDNDTPYGRRVPWQNPYFNSLPQVSGFAGGVNQDIVFGNPRPGGWTPNSTGGDYQVTEAYWKSQKKVGKLTWLNPETGIIEKSIVDETVVLPENTKVKEGNLHGDEPDDDSVFVEDAFRPTIEWTWINEVWGGVKITPMGSPGHSQAGNKPLYLNVKPLAFQGKPDTFLYEAELPVVGSVFNQRNGESQSLVDLVKPYQIAYNLFLNQAYIMAEEEILPFLLMDINAIPKLKDWKGPDGFEKWMEALRSLHAAPVDTKPSNLNGANPGGQLPAVINLDVTQRMMTRFQLAQAFKQMAMEQIGITPQRMGDIKPQETATGVSQAAQRSYVQTATLFSKFYHYYQRTLKKTLDFSQYVQAAQKELIVSATNSDYSNALLALNGTELLLVQLGVFVSNNQQDLRDVEIGKQLALENNTILTSMADRYDMATLNSKEKIREVLRNSDLKNEQVRQQSQSLEQQKIQSAEKMQTEKLDWDAEQKQLDRDNRLEEAYIKTFGGKNNSTTADTDGSGTFDSLEFDKFNQTVQTATQKAQSDNQKNELNRLKLVQQSQEHQDNIQFQREKLKSDQKIAQIKLKSSTELGNKAK